MSPRMGLDRDAVVQAAAELVCTEGMQALSLGQLAKRLAVQTPSLYNHIAGLPDLQRELALLNVLRLGECVAHAVVAKSGPAALAALAQAYREHIKACPSLYQSTLRASGVQEQPDPRLEAAEAQVLETVLAVMASFGLAGDEALHAVRILRSVVHGFATLEAAGGFGLPLDCDESFGRMLDWMIRAIEPPNK